jgi:hypothetical protein
MVMAGLRWDDFTLFQQRPPTALLTALTSETSARRCRSGSRGRSPRPRRSCSRRPPRCRRPSEDRHPPGPSPGERRAVSGEGPREETGPVPEPPDEERVAVRVRADVDLAQLIVLGAHLEFRREETAVGRQMPPREAVGEFRRADLVDALPDRHQVSAGAHPDRERRVAGADHRPVAERRAVRAEGADRNPLRSAVDRGEPAVTAGRRGCRWPRTAGHRAQGRREPSGARSPRNPPAGSPPRTARTAKAASG